MKKTLIPLTVIYLCLILNVTAFAQSGSLSISSNNNLFVKNEESVYLGIKINSSSVTGNYQIVVSAAHGILIVPSSSDLSGVSGNNSGVVTITGNFYYVNTILSSLLFKPEAGFSGADVVNVQGYDVNNSQTAFIKVTVNISDAPQITAPDTESVLCNSDLKISGLSLSYPSNQSGSVWVTLYSVNGILTIPAVSSSLYIKGNGTEKLTMLGSLDNINSALSGLIYHSSPQYHGTDLVTVSINDMGDLTSTSTNIISAAFSINVLDRPHIMVQTTKDSHFTATAGTDMVIPSTLIRDETIGLDPLRITVSAQHGTLSLNTKNSLSNVTGDGSATVIINGSLATVNSFLSLLTYKMNDGYYGADAISITAYDVNTSAACTAAINVNSGNINNLLIVAAPKELPAAYSEVNKLQGILITYLNSVNNNMQVTLSVSHGIVSLPSSNGLAYTHGNNTKSITLAGSLTSINQALGTMTYTPDKDYAGNDGISVEVIDLNTYQSASAASTLNVISKGDQGTSETNDIPDKTVTENVISIEPLLDKVNRSAKAALTKDDIANAVMNAKQDDKGNRYITVHINPLSGAGTYTLTVPSDILTDPSGSICLKLETPLGLFTIPSSIFYGNSDTTNDITISITNSNLNGFPSNVGAIIGNRPAIELKALQNGADVIWDQNSATITALMPYTPTYTEANNTDFIAIHSIDISGTLIPVADSNYSASEEGVIFKMDHPGKYAVTYLNKTFSDLDKYPWAKKQIGIMASRGIINGTSNTNFSPGKNITRGDFIKLLIETLGLRADITDNFSDVSKKSHYYSQTGIAKKLGITGTDKVDKFRPDDYITRLDMIVFTANALSIIFPDMPTGTYDDISQFVDIGRLSQQEKIAAATLVRNKVIAGEGKKINPSGYMSRAEAAVVLYRLLQMS